MPAGEKKPKYEITIPGQEPFGMAAVWKLWKNQRQVSGSVLSLY
jgi:hypothetical protein